MLPSRPVRHDTDPMHLSVRQKKHLRKLGHDLKPIVTTGTSGVTAAVIAELDSALDHHELVKIKIRVGDRQARNQALTAFKACRAAGVEPPTDLYRRLGRRGALDLRQ